MTVPMLTLKKNKGDAHLEVLVMAMEQLSKMSVMMRLGEEIHCYKTKYASLSPHTLSLFSSFLSFVIPFFYGFGKPLKRGFEGFMDSMRVKGIWV